MRQPDPRELCMRLGLLLQVQRRARQAAPQELPFIFVNETRVLVPYRQAAFWQVGRDGAWKVAAVSGLATPDSGAPFVLWLEALGRAMRREAGRTPASAALADDTSAVLSTVIDKTALPKDVIDSWEEWLPSAGLWLPLYARGELVGALALFRDDPFLDGERELLDHLGESYAQCLLVRPAAQRGSRLTPALRNWRLWAIVAACVILLLPIRQSVLAPAEVTPLEPAHIRSGLDGVVKRLFVRPNQVVAVGDKLFDLEDDQLRTRLIVAQKNLEMSRAELQQTQQLSLVDPRAKIRLPLLQGRVEQLTAEVELVESQLARVLVVSPVAGIAVCDDPDIWLGRPVSLGQKIMEVADPAKVQLEVSLPMSETLPLAQGDGVLFFPNVSPHAPLSASLMFIGYQAADTPEAGLAFTLRAGFDPGAPLPRLGLRGTVKLYGERMPLIMLLLRRPVLQARQWLGI